MNELNVLFQSTLTGNGLFALPVVLLGGIVVGVNPCCLLLYPAGVTTCCASRSPERDQTLLNSLLFVTGIALATALLGMVAVMTSRLMMALSGWFFYLIALIPVLMGLHLLKLLPLPVPRLALTHASLKGGGSFLMGFLFSLILTPCGTPILASVLSYAASKGNVLYAGLLLFCYGLGMGLPLLLLGSTLARLAAWLDGKGWRGWVDRASGLMLTGLGIYLIVFH